MRNPWLAKRQRSIERGLSTKRYKPLTKHALLSGLSAEDLRAYVDHYELEVADRRVKTQLVDALVRSEEATIEGFLSGWRRDELKALCRALDIDDSGRRKADLIARLAGSGEKPERNDAGESKPRRESARAAKGKGKTTARAKNNGATTGYEAELWAMADALRGSMDASEYKHVALGLIFLKYISDAFEAKRTELLRFNVRCFMVSLVCSIGSMNGHRLSCLGC